MGPAEVERCTAAAVPSAAAARPMLAPTAKPGLGMDAPMVPAGEKCAHDNQRLGAAVGGSTDQVTSAVRQRGGKSTGRNGWPKMSRTNQPPGQSD